jgi:hypothetical protein
MTKLKYLTVEVKSLLKSVDTSACFGYLLFARIERMALGANFDFDSIALSGRTADKPFAAGAFYRNHMVIGMNILFHLSDS